jgi:FlaA1/EpsC-like NDP-sugar epimerase
MRANLAAAVLDICLFGLAFGGSFLMRYTANAPRTAWHDFLGFMPIAIAVLLVCNALGGLYGQIWRHASIVEARRLVAACAVVTAILAGVLVVGPRMVPLSVLVSGMTLYALLAGAARFQARLFGVRRRAASLASVRVLLVGAGETGAMLVREMKADRGSRVPVAFLDDDPRKQRRNLLGVPVLGPISELAHHATKLRVDEVLLAITTSDQRVRARVSELAEQADVPLRVVPRVGDLVHGKIGLSDVRDLRIDDLLGRPPVDIDLDAVRALVQGKRVLITGAGGSIGSEIARQVAGFNPAKLLLLDHDETHLFDTCRVIRRHDIVVQLLADVRQRAIVNRIFDRHRPQMVFHAAAHKHVPLLEKHPSEAVRTNVCGTDNLVDAALAVGVERFVFISTDKAVRPTSVMGASKRLAEHVVLSSATQGANYCAVRFGNVLGSRGSVVPTFLDQIAQGGPVTITDARMTRFFMTIPEAVELVLQAASLAGGGEVFMLDMGEPVKIRVLAERLIRLRGRRPGTDVPIRVTGIRPGEKLTEELHAPEEQTHPTTHRSIVRLSPKPLPAATLSKAVASLNLLAEEARDEQARTLLFDLAAGRISRHKDGLLTLRHRRRASDIDGYAAESETGSSQVNHPYRRTTDIALTAGATYPTPRIVQTESS